MKLIKEIKKHFDTKTKELEYWERQPKHIKELCEMFYMQGIADYQKIMIGRDGSKSAS